jgi:hypothetical protein
VDPRKIHRDVLGNQIGARVADPVHREVQKEEATMTGDAVQKRHSHRDPEALGENKNIGEKNLPGPGIESGTSKPTNRRSIIELSQLACSFRPESHFSLSARSDSLTDSMTSVTCAGYPIG